MTDQELLLEEFIEWLSEKDDVYFAFDNTTEAIKQFIQTKKEGKEL